MIFEAKEGNLMPTHYHMNIAGCKRALPICPLNDKLSIGAFVIFGDCELTQACASALLERAPEFDHIVVNDILEQAVAATCEIIDNFIAE